MPNENFYTSPFNFVFHFPISSLHISTAHPSAHHHPPHLNYPPSTLPLAMLIHLPALHLNQAFLLHTSTPQRSILSILHLHSLVPLMPGLRPSDIPPPLLLLSFLCALFPIPSHLRQQLQLSAAFWVRTSVSLFSLASQCSLRQRWPGSASDAGDG